VSDVNRRDTLKAIAGVTMGATAATVVTSGCDKASRDRQPTNTKADAMATNATSKESAKSSDDAQTVLSIAPLGFPWRTMDPFLFCVHHDDRYPAGNDLLGPAASLAGRNLGQDFEGRDGWRMYHGEIVPGFPQHPHRGFETVTVVRRGLLDHSDSMGATARYGGGDVQWLTAGKGIQHAEMFPLLNRHDENPTELFQIWLNLPAASKMVDPYFAMFWNQTVPKLKTRDSSGHHTEVTVVAGSFGETTPPAPPPNSWASRADAHVAIWTVKMDSGARFTLPAAAPGTNRLLYFFRGSGLAVNGRAIPPGHQAQIRADAGWVLEAGGRDRSDETEILILQGRPINEPVAQYGPFVMNTQDEIRQAFADYQRTQFGGWPWDRPDPVHSREQGRFARLLDGRLDRPT
jgi:hypothetical protein